MRNNKYVKVLQLGMQNEMEYRANYWLQMAGFMLPIMTQIFLWLAVFGSSGQARVLGYSLPEMLVYVVMAGVTGKLIATGFEYEIATDIKEGGLAKFMVQPVHYFAYRFAGLSEAKSYSPRSCCWRLLFCCYVLAWKDKSASGYRTSCFTYWRCRERLCLILWSIMR